MDEIAALSMNSSGRGLEKQFEVRINLINPSLSSGSEERYERVLAVSPLLWLESTPIAVGVEQY